MLPRDVARRGYISSKTRIPMLVTVHTPRGHHESIDPKSGVSSWGPQKADHIVTAVPPLEAVT
jgi:hypothetical protein